MSQTTPPRRTHPDPDEVAAAVRAMWAAGKYDDAEAALYEAVESYPIDPALLADFAWNAALRRDWEQAASRYEQIRTRFPRSPAGWVGTARVLCEMGRAEESDDIARRGSELFPENGDLLVERGRAALRRQDWEAAAALFAEVRTRFPDMANGYVLGARTLEEARRFEDADAVLAAAAQRFPDHEYILTRFAKSAHRLRKWQETLLRFDLLSARFGESEAAWLARADALQGLNRGDEADAALLKAALLSADARSLLINAMLQAHRRHDWAVVVRRGRLLTTRFPDTAVGYGAMAEALSRLGRPAEYDTVLQAGVAACPEDFNLAADYAVALAQGDRPDTALPFVEQLRLRFQQRLQTDQAAENRVRMAEWIYHRRAAASAEDDEAGEPAPAQPARKTLLSRLTGRFWNRAVAHLAPGAAEPATAGNGDDSSDVTEPERAGLSAGRAGLIPAAGTQGSRRNAAAGGLQVLTSYYNLTGSKRRRANYDRFIAEMQEAGVPCLTIVCDHPDHAPEKLGGNVLRVTSCSWLWHKERLLNIGLQQLPSTSRYVAWIDCDVSFLSPQWPGMAVEILQNFPVAQLFSETTHLGPDDERPAPNADWRASFAWNFHRSPNGAGPGYYEHGHPGFAWAANRDVLAAGLLDTCVIGGGDDVMAHVFAGSGDSACVERIVGPADAPQRAAVEAWRSAVEPLVRGQLGVVPVRLAHHWHGSEADRQYTARWRALAASGFDPRRDLVLNAFGCWEWSRTNSAPEAVFIKYMQSRADDGRPEERVTA